MNDATRPRSALPAPLERTVEWLALELGEVIARLDALPAAEKHVSVADVDEGLADLETVVQFLDRELGSIRYVLGGVLQDLYGSRRCHEGAAGDFARYAHDALYPVVEPDLPAGCNSARVVVWRPPPRRSTGFTRSTLVELARKHGIKDTAHMSRASLVRALRRRGVIGNVRVVGEGN